jgi:hypothetical protein
MGAWWIFQFPNETIILSMLKKILKILFLSDKRKGSRQLNQNLSNVLFLALGKTFVLSNLSEKGFGIRNSTSINFSLHQILEGDLEFDMAERVHLKVKVARVKDHDVGFEILNAGKNFREQLFNLSK